MPFEDDNMGACLIANDLPSLGKEIIDRRVQGQSWKQIGEDLKIGSPGTARKTFTKITGIKDYKTKGQALKALAKQSGFLDEFGEVALKQSFKSATEGLAAGDTKLAESATKKLNGAIKDVKVSAADIDAAEEDMFFKYGDKVEDVLDKAHAGKGYTAISKETGIPIPDIDRIVWNDLLSKSDGDIWKAYTSKATSQTGGDAVKKLISDLRQTGLTVDEIVDATGIPKTVVQAVLNDTWKIPTTAGSKAIIPDPPPPPPKTVSIPDKLDGGDYRYHSSTEMTEWHRQLGYDMTSDQLASLKSYTNSGYVRINGGLRGGTSGGKTVQNIDAVMRPIPFDTIVTRGTGPDTFRSMGITPSNAHDLVGKVFEDPGFLSTSITESPAFGGTYKLVIEVPKGTQARWVGPGSNISVHRGENELVLGRGTPLLITEVQTFANGKVLVKARVL